MNKIFLIIFLFLANTSYSQVGSKLIDKDIVDSILNSYCNPGEPGMAVGVVQNGKIIYKNTKGLADLSNHIVISDSTAFNIASVSKQFTSLIALMAEEEGKISLQDEITKYLPELENLPYKITIQQLANHTHGLPSYSDLMEMIGFGLATPITNKEAVQILLNLKSVNFEPGSQYQYGNSGYILLAEILTRVYEKPFPALVREKIFEPLQMSQSTVIDHPNIIVKNKAVPYTYTNEGYQEHQNKQMESGSSNIHSSLNDMLKWAINFQNPTTGTQSQLTQLMTKTVSLSKEGDLVYGLGLFTETYKGIETVFHGGGTAGFRAYILHAPKHNLSIVTLGNQESFDGLLIVKDLLELYLQKDIIEPEPSNITYTAKELKKFEGTYQFCPGQYWAFKTEGDNLFFEGIDQPLPVVGEKKFKFFNPTSFLTFYSNSVDFRIADFNFHCEKIEFNPPVLSNTELEKFVGIYKNEEFNTFYELILIENHLVAKHLTNGEIQLHPLSENSFYAPYPLGELRFEISKAENVNGFVLSGQNFANIKFKKMK